MTYWDSIHPQLDPDDDLDPTIRVNILEELNSYEFIVRPLSLAYLVESKSIGRFCLRDLQYATDKIETPEDVSKPDINVIRGAFLDVDPEILSTTREAISDSLLLVGKIEDWVDEKVGASQAPSLSPLKSLLKEVVFDFQQYAGNELAQEIGDANDAVEYPDATSTETTIPKVKSVPVGINNRQDVLRMLDLICKYYEEQEPSSPVPMLLHRAKYLVTADFMTIVQNLMPDGLSQLEIIKGPDPFSE
jgi:type VI secretion system protein ImpA